MVDLNNEIGNTFYTNRYSDYQEVILEEIRKDKVKLKHKDQIDSFTYPIAKFIKFYKIKKK